MDSKRWLSSLDEVARELSSVAPDTEEEFLSLGERLQEFVGQAQAMAGLAASIAEHTGGGTSSAMDRIREVLDKTLRGIEECSSEFPKGLSLLKGIASRLDGLSSLQGDLERIAKQTRIMGVSIKIESARVGREGQGFWDLAEEVTELAVRIHENVRHFKDKMQASRELVDSCRTLMGSKVTRYGREVTSISRRINAALEDLSRSLGESAAVGERLSARSEDINLQVGKVVMAMQFHDIVRQQLEHVVAAIQEVRAQLGDRGKDETGSPGTPETRWIGPVLSIQVSHLKETVEEIRVAGKDIAAGLCKVAELCQGQFEDAMFLASGGKLESGKTVFERLEGELDAISSTLSECAEFSRTMVQDLDAVLRSAEEMEQDVKTVKEIGERIKLSALNALAEATRTGDKGRALRVLAKELHLFSEGTSTTTGKTSRALEAVSAAAREQETFINRLEEKHRDVEQAMHETLSLSRALGEESAIVTETAERLDLACKGFQADIDRAVKAIRFPEQMTRIIEACEEILCGLLAECDVNVDPGSLSSRDREVLQRLAANYSMEKEREVHKQAASPAIGSAEARPGAGSDEMLQGSLKETGRPSDNATVEFFGDDEVEIFGDAPPGKNGPEVIGKIEETPQPPRAKGADDLGDNVELF